MAFLSKFFNSFRGKSDTADSTPSSGSPDPTDRAIDGLTSDIAAQDADLSLIAVITAAVAMMMSESSGRIAPYPGFVVKRIRRLM